MSTATTISQLARHVGGQVTLRGWLYNARCSGKLLFLILRDGTGMCQCVLEKTAQNAADFEHLEKIGQESSLEVSGDCRAEPRSEGGHEIQLREWRVLQAADGYPITLKPHGIDFLFKHRHLWFRSKRQWVILRIRATIVDEIRSFLNRNGFILIDTPIFAPSAGEGAQTLFKVDYFGEPVYLAQTGQLYLEAAAMAHRKVYCFGPTFRAEKSKTRRHLTEFWMVEPEMAFCSLTDVMDLAEEFVRSIVQRVLRDHRDDLVFLGRDLARLEAVLQPFYRITYSEAADLLRGAKTRELLAKNLEAALTRREELQKLIEQKEKERAAPGTKKWKADKLAAEVIEHHDELAELQTEIENIPQHQKLAGEFEWGGDLGGSDETIIARLHDRPVFVSHYPRQCKAFYMKRDPADSRVVQNIDLLAHEGFGEIIGGSQREDDYDSLLERIREEGLRVEDYEWYLELRKYGSVPHGGFGLGVERTVRWICGLQHIRETIPYPRLMGRFYP